MNLVAAIDITNLHKKIGILEKKSSSGGLINFVYDDIDLFEILSIPSLKQSRISENSSYWYVTYKNISVIDAARKKLIHQPIHADFFFRFSFFFFLQLTSRSMDRSMEDLVSSKRDRIQSIRNWIFFHKRDMRTDTSRYRTGYG